MNRPIVFGAAALLAIVPARAHAQTFPSSAGPLAVSTVARGLVEPWSLAFLPDGRMLVTEKPGRMRIVTRDGTLSPPLGGVPAVHAAGQSGLLDLRLDNDHASNHLLYFCYSLDAGGANNYGCRIVQAPDGNLFVTLGDHFGPRDQAQNLANHIGKIVRIRPDGSAPPDNPFVGRRDAKPEIWAYGVRNPQGLAFDPATGKLWEQEHGPRGGDEVNIIGRGKNYGWPVIGYGIDYNGAKIHDRTAKDGMEQPVKYWVPSIAPSGMLFYTGKLFPKWSGSLFTGALAGTMLVRLSLNGNTVTSEERLLQNLHERIRDVRQGPDGALWLLTDSSAGRIVRVTPSGR